MKNVFLFSILINISNITFTQNKIDDQFCIEGKILDNIHDKDSIYFFNGDIDKKYYELPFVSSEIIKLKFRLCLTISYVHLYKIRFKSEKDILEWRGGYYFIDKNSNSLIIDSIDALSRVYSLRENEFYADFIPFMLDSNKFNSISSFIFEDPDRFESKLYEYVIANPNSYVALWFLIERFISEGHSEFRQNILNSFSNNIRNGKLWKIARSDFKSIRIKESNKFPRLQLLDTGFSIVKLKIKSSKYTLVNYWFSRCKPCLEEMPMLLKLYKEYHKKGFEIINISTDQSKNIPNWKAKIKGYNLIWPQYLDENGVESLKDNINKFPTNYLLDNRGKIIRKDIPFNELERLLKQI